MEMKQVANYLNSKFLINNMKADRKAILNGKLLSSYSVGALGSGNVVVQYFDTPDFFFAEKGINIYTKTSNEGTVLIIRYDSEQVSRIEFLKNTPNYFQVQINNNSDIKHYYDQITEAIYSVFPTGLNVNIEDYLRTSSVQIRINKKCETYRVVNNNGLKATLSFEMCEYIKTGTKSKFKQPVLDIVCDSYRLKDIFEPFLKDIIIDYPQLIKLKNNELTIARENI